MRKGEFKRALLTPGWRLEMEWRDLMHIGPLGMDKDLGASLVVDLFEHDQLEEGSTLASSRFESCLGRLHGVELIEWCKKNRIQKPKGKFTPANVGRPKGDLEYPVLASTFKAADTKIIVHFICERV